MTTQEKIGYIRKAMDAYVSDNLERASAAFRHFDEREMAQQYGDSGKTRQEIIDGYAHERSKWLECNVWLINQLGGR